MLLAQVKIDQNIFPAAKFSNFGILLNLVLPLVMSGAGLIFLFMMLYSAFNILTHGDNPDALKKAYGSMVFAVIGLILVIASFLAVRIIGKMIGAGDLIPQ